MFNFVYGRAAVMEEENVQFSVKALCYPAKCAWTGIRVQNGFETHRVSDPWV